MRSIEEIVADAALAARAHEGRKQGKDQPASRRSIAQRPGAPTENTIKNIEEPGQREPGKRGANSPLLANVAALARVYGVEPWHFLVEGFDPAVPLPKQPPTAAQLRACDEADPALVRIVELVNQMNGPFKTAFWSDMILYAERQLALYRSVASPQEVAGALTPFPGQPQAKPRVA